MKDQTPKPKQSVSHERAIKGYLEPLLQNKLPKILDVTGYNKSELVNAGIRAIMEQRKIL